MNQWGARSRAGRVRERLKARCPPLYAFTEGLASAFALPTLLGMMLPFAIWRLRRRLIVLATADAAARQAKATAIAMAATTATPRAARLRGCGRFGRGARSGRHHDMAEIRGAGKIGPTRGHFQAACREVRPVPHDAVTKQRLTAKKQGRIVDRHHPGGRIRPRPAGSLWLRNSSPSAPRRCRRPLCRP